MSDENVQYVGCVQCDALYEKQEIEVGEKFVCHRCHATLQINKKDTVERSFAISLAGLLLLYPAMFFPLIGLSAAGLLNDASLSDCILTLLNSELYIIATSLFFFTFAIPVVRLGACFYICFAIKFLTIRPHHLNFFRSYHLLDNFTMLHVFFLGIAVSMYKLVAMAHLTFGVGLIGFILLLFASTLISVTLDQQSIWDKLEKLVTHENH